MARSLIVAGHALGGRALEEVGPALRGAGWLLGAGEVFVFCPLTIRCGFSVSHAGAWLSFGSSCQ